LSEHEPTQEEIRGLIAALQKMDVHKRFNKILFWIPYPKQLAFFELGSTKRERMFMAANRVGKTEAGAFETACHLTGEYPEWWEGARFGHPIKAWAAGTTSLEVRNIMQTKLCGQYGIVKAFGTGMIPKRRFTDKPSLARGVTDAFDTVQVEHRTKGIVDGVSTLAFKSYEQGRPKFQGEDLDFGWADEEPEPGSLNQGMELYSEFLTRINGPGRMMITFTPLFGPTNLVDRFMKEPSDDRAIVSMILAEAEHFTEAEKKQRAAGYLVHEREAREMGMPMLGQGRVWPYSPEMIKEPLLEYIPQHWTKLWGIDFGIGHPFAAVLTLWDRDNDVIHVHNCYRQKDVQPIHHAVAIKSKGANVPVAWPQDGTARESSGKPLASLYREQQLLMLPQHATFVDGTISTEAGLLEIDQRMTTGRFKVAAHLSDWFEEFLGYHRKDGQVVKFRDDLMSATRIAVMAKRHGRPVEIGTDWAKKRKATQAKDVDFDPFWPGD
jgi:phage terminase large subunit-like protein